MTNSLDHLSALVTRMLTASKRGGVKTCLWIGRNDRFAASLADQLAGAGSRSAVYVAAATDGAECQPIDGAYRIIGYPLGPSDFPVLSDIVAFAQTRADPGAETAAVGRALRSCRESEHRPSLDSIAADFGLAHFDLAVIAGEAALASSIVGRVRGSGAILLDGTRTTFGGSHAFATLFADPQYVLSACNDHELGGWALFVQRDQASTNLPIHFFTIILNGEPFIRYHEKMLLELDFPWHWHVIEGVASLVKDTAWSVAAGGRIPDDLHHRGKSNDGTTEYLDELQARYPNRVSIYRKPPDVFWDGKLEMVSAPIPHINEECLLWQIDGDELWTPGQIRAVRDAFIADPTRSAAYFWCNYYVGPDKGISTRLNYAQNPEQEWLRVWRFEPGMIWDKHEPPVLAGKDGTGASYDVGKRHPFTHREMESIGAVFDHFAYTTEAQAQFKESYYGYSGAVEQWRALQAHDRGSGHLRDYFAWVSDDTMFDTVDRLDLAPLAYVDAATGEWRFRSADEQAALRRARRARRRPRVVVDGVFFQLASSGIARVWIGLLKEWVRTGYADNIVVLDRAKTAPRLDGVIYRTIDAHTWDTVDGDARYLQEICDLEGADLFVSTYYTTPTTTPSVFFGHDMIPERMGFDLEDLWWRQKRRAIQYAAGHIMVSQSSANDLCAFHPDVDPARVLVAHNSVSEVFHPCTASEIAAFTRKYAIDRPFVMMVGERFGWKGYKNGAVVFAALAQIPEERRPLLVCVGGRPDLEDVGRAFLGESDVRILKLDDDDLRAAFGAALAYICPSSLEGFGLPIAEAMTVGCPALVCPNSSIPEVAGDAGIYFDPNDPSTLVEAIERVRDARVRDETIARGKAQAATFNQAKTAALIADYFERVVEEVRSGAVRPQSQALEDAFKDAEARRRVEAEARQLGEVLAAMKREVAASTRISPTAAAGMAVADVPSVAALVASQDTSLMIALERRLAAAYAQLRAYEQAGGFSEPSSLPRPPSLVEAVSQVFQDTPAINDCLLPADLRGLTDLEGPYPTAGVHHRFRWQVEATSVVVFDVPAAGAALLEFDFCNVEPDQSITVTAAGQVLGVVTPPETGWQCEWHVAYPFEVEAGRVEVRLEASRCSDDHGDGVCRYFSLLGIALRTQQFEEA